MAEKFSEIASSPNPKTHDFSPQPNTEMFVSHREHRTSGSEGSTVVADHTPPYAETGAPINRSQTADMNKSLNPGLQWPRWRHTLREAFSEFMGTFILIMFGDGVVAQVVLSNGEKGNYQSISWGWVSTRQRSMICLLTY
jgi:aquaglyceroporin related protein